MKKTLIYKHNGVSKDMSGKLETNEYTVKLWHPSFIHFVPPNKSIKYLFYWFFHYLRIFKNNNYSALLVYHKNRLITSLLIVPAHFKWPFMAQNDLQFTYVMTAKEYRGQGLAAQALLYILHNFNEDDRTFWYVTDIKNQASIHLCKKIGFEFQGYGERKGFLNCLYFQENHYMD